MTDCTQVPTLDEIYQAKKNITDLDTFTNSTADTFVDSDGVTKLTLVGLIKNIGFAPADFDFTDGGTLSVNDRNVSVFYETDGNWYSWGGVLPKTIPETSSPSSTGGIDINAWNISTSAFMYRDYRGFKDELYAQTEITDNGLPNQLGDSQIVEGIIGLAQRYSESRPTVAHFGSDDRSAIQRTLHLVGDSHTYGQGSRGDIGDFLLQNHATRYGARTWSTMLKDAFYRDWDSQPYQFVPSQGGVNAENKVTGLRGLYTSSKNFNIADSEFVHPHKGFYALEDHFTDTEIRMLNYNTTQGFYANTCLFAGYEPELSKSYRIPNEHAFTPTGMTWFDTSGRCGIFTSITCIDGVSRARAFITSNFEIPEIAEGDVFYVQCETDLSNLVVSLAIPRQCVCEDIQIISGKFMYAFSFSDGTSLDQPSLEALMLDANARWLVTPANAPKVIVPISSARSLIGVDVICGYGGVNTIVELNPTNGTGEFLAGDWYYSAAASLGQGFNVQLIEKISDSGMLGLDAGSYQFIGSSALPNKTLELNTSLNLNEVGGSLYSDLPFWLYYSVKVSGVLILKPTKPKKYTQSSIGFHIGVRGVIDTDMTKVCTHGFGCHSVGDWVGRTADICSHDGGVPFDHTIMMRKCEEIQNQETRMMVIQAPIVNEYLRQTSIVQYKSDLTSFYDSMMTGVKKSSRVIIFTGAGQIGHDSYLGPITTSSPITYQMYRDATKDWAIENGIAYVDASLRQKQLIDDGIATGTDFLMKTGVDYDSNHPNMYVHKLWFESIYPVASRLFQ